MVSKDHLHIRGEYRNRLSTKKKRLGIISTYVENTTQMLWGYYHQWDHLHIRGEYYYNIKPFDKAQGSSPHTWRIPISSSCMLITSRIISTYVENTQIYMLMNPINKDHLHIRGEYPNIKLVLKIVKGSSPHTWRILFFA